MFSIRMNLGDPHFVNINKYTSEMLSPSFANKIRQKILDNTTLSLDYYMNGYKLPILIIIPAVQYCHQGSHDAEIFIS